MSGLGTIFRPLRALAATATPTEPTSGQIEPQKVARRVAEALDRAMALGLWESADGLAQAPAPLAPGFGKEPLQGSVGPAFSRRVESGV